MNQLRFNIIANFVGRAWTGILSILLIPVYLKFMGIEAYGLVGFYTMMLSILGFMDLGLGATLTRELARLSADKSKAREQRNLVRTLETIYWLIAILIGLLVVVAAPFIAQTWIRSQNMSVESIQSAVRLMGISILLQFSFSFYRGGLMGLQRQVLVNMILVVGGTVQGVGSVLVLWMISPTIQAFLIWQALISALSCSVAVYYLWHSLPLATESAHFQKSMLTGLWRYAAAMSGNSAVGVLLTQLDKVILSRMLSLEMFGYYTLAYTIASGIWLIIIPFNNALFPRFVQLFELGSLAEIDSLLHRSSQVLSVLLLPVTIVLVLFSKEILQVWTQDQMVAQNAHLIVSLLVFGVALNGMTSVPVYATAAFGWPQLITYTNLAQAFILVPAIVIMTRLYGAVGAASVWIVLNCTYLFAMVPITFGRYFKSEKWRWYIHDEGMPLLGAALVGVTSYLVKPSNLGMGLTISWLLGTIILCIMMSAFFAPYVRDKILAHVRKICRLYFPATR